MTEQRPKPLRVTLPEEVTCSLCMCGIGAIGVADYEADMMCSAIGDESFLLIRCEACAANTTVTDGGEA